ncbi:GerAB/ArcD/ProY family transporter [Staphylospora marina]|uniref:GerAB/ArcD/ProY family transporter n=1 Tax=Staphylospora marina TaxID=2490858 RepID=UPI000F5C0DA2|nr:GerAB/ArcD/ProY family transporter [Staphylospora marina]
MQIQEKHKITPTQFTFFVIQAMVGVGILSLPYNVHQLSRGGAWISTIIAGVIAQITLFIQWSLNKRYPKNTLYGILRLLAGKWIGTGLAVLYLLYFFMTSALILILFTDIVGRWVLTETPRWVILALMAGSGLYLGKENTRIIARFMVPISYLIFVLVTLVLLSYFDVDIRYMLPLTEAGWKNILIGSHEAFLAMVGYEVILILYPFIGGGSRDVLRAGSIGMWLVVAFYTFVTFSSVIYFSPQEILMVQEPVLYMMKSYTFRILERIDLLFLTLWLVNVLTSYITYVHLTAIGIQELLGDRVNVRRKSAGLLTIGSTIMAGLFSDPEATKILGQIASLSGYLFFLGIPLLFLGISALKRMWRRRS